MAKLHKERDALERRLRVAEDETRAQLAAQRTEFAAQLVTLEASHEETKEAHADVHAEHHATKAELEAIHERLLRESEEHAATHDTHAAAHEEKDEAHSRTVEEYRATQTLLEQEVVDVRGDAEELHRAKCTAEATVHALRAEIAELGRQLQIALVVQDDSMTQHYASLENEVRALQTRLAEAQLARSAGVGGSGALSAAELAEHWQAVLCADDDMSAAAGGAEDGGVEGGDACLGAIDARRARGAMRFSALRSENARLVDQIGALREVHDAQRAAAALELRRKALSNVVLRHALRRAKATIALLRWNRSGNGAESARRAIEIVRTHRDETRRQLKQLALARWTTGAARWRTWVMKSAMTRLHQHGAAHVQRELTASRTEGAALTSANKVCVHRCSPVPAPSLPPSLARACLFPLHEP